MLVSLHMKNIALVQEEEISFGEGLNILTGETGAGKSIIIGGISSALGAASLKDYCPDDADHSLVELIFETSLPEVEALLAEKEIPFEDGQVVISRKYRNGKTINRINGETVTAAMLRETAALLIDIHGQHQHQSLLRTATHRMLLDRYAGALLGGLLQECRACAQAYHEAEEKLRETVMDESQRIKQIDLLQYEIGEIEDACLTEGEDEELEQKYRIMSNGQKIMEALAETASLTGGDEGASSMISRAVRSLAAVASWDKGLEELHDQLSELESLFNDFDRSLSDCMDDYEYDEETFEQTGARLDTINRLKLKYGRGIQDILKALQERREMLEQIENYERYRESLRQEAGKRRQELLNCAGRISVIRKKMAVPLQEQITKALADLNFPDVKFEIRFTQLPEPNASGMDEVQFLVSLNPGIPLRPLQDVASGGELSRIMLAIKAVMADQDEIETLIFDEIDTGISGRTAQKVSEKMAVISGSHQVICITHLPQIAAMADQHFVIEKITQDGRARTRIRLLEEKETIDELSRILGGASITDTVVRSSLEMKEQAAQIKEKIRQQ